MNIGDIDKAEIIKRGYITTEEWDVISPEGQMEKLNIGIREKNGQLSEVEGIWVYPLEPSDVSGEKFHFVFFNDPIHFMFGPRPTAGLVGIATSKGPKLRAEATYDDCLELFRKYGKEPIEYHERALAEWLASKEGQAENQNI